MVDTDNEVKLDLDLLVMFRCPAYAKEGLLCIFSSMRDIEKKTGLKCKSLPCKIRIPEKEKDSD